MDDESRERVESYLLQAAFQLPAFAEDSFAAIGPDDFVIPGNRELYYSLQAAYDSVEPGHRPNPLLVFTQAQKLGLSDKMSVVGKGLDFIDSMGAERADHGEARQIMDTLIGMANATRLMQAGRMIYSLGESGDPDGVNRAETMLVQALERNGAINPEQQTLSSITDKIMESINTNTGTSMSMVPTGIAAFDTMTFGVQAGRLWLFAALSHTGKTAVGLNMAVKSSLVAGTHVLYASKEQGAQELALNIMALVTGKGVPWILSVPEPAERLTINSNEIRLYAMPAKERDEKLSKLREAGSNISLPDLTSEVKLELTNAAMLDRRMNITFDSAFTGEAYLRTRARRLARQTHGDFLLCFLDYLQIAPSDRDNSTTNERLAYMGRQLKASALDDMVGKSKQPNGAWVTFSQFTKEAEKAIMAKRDELTISTPPREFFTKNMLRDSGAIENDPDVIFFLSRNELHMGMPPRLWSRMNTSCMKNRQTGILDDSFAYLNTRNQRIEDNPNGSTSIGTSGQDR